MLRSTLRLRRLLQRRRVRVRLNPKGQAVVNLKNKNADVVGEEAEAVVGEELQGAAAGQLCDLEHQSHQ